MKMDEIIRLWEYKAESKRKMPKKYIRYATEFWTYMIKHCVLRVKGKEVAERMFEEKEA